MKDAAVRPGGNHRQVAEFVVVTICLLILATLIFGQLLHPGQAPYSPHSDFLHQHLSIKDSLYRAVQAGHGPPLWRSDQFSGVTAWANPQAQYTYPFHLLFWFLPPINAVGPTLWLHFVLAGLAMYVLALSLQRGRAGRVFMALAGLVNYRFILAAGAGWLPVLSTMTMVPFVLASLIWNLRVATWRSTLVLTLATSLALVTGGMQLCYYAALFSVVIVGVELAARRRGAHSEGVRSILLQLAVASALSIGLSAHVWLPIAGEAPLLSRGELSYSYFLSGVALRPTDWSSLLSPFLLTGELETGAGSPWERCAYFGLVPFLLAALGAIRAPKQRAVLVLLCLTLLSLLLTLDSPLLRGLFELAPGFRLFRGPGRFLLFTGIFGIALAGFGADELLRWLQRRSRLLTTSVVACLALLMLAEGAVASRELITMRPCEEVLPDPAYRRYLEQDPDLFRVATILRDTINYGWASPFGLQLIHGGDAINYSYYKRYFNRIQQAHTPPEARQPWNDLHGISNGSLLDALGVRYLVTPFEIPSPPPNLELVATFHEQAVFRYFTGLEQATLWIYRNLGALPRAFLVEQVIHADTEDEALEHITGFQPDILAVVEGHAAPGTSTAQQGDRAEIVSWEPGQLEVAVRTHLRRFLVVSEIWHPGWSAELDGRDIALAKTDVALLGAWMPEGEHSFRLTFRPRYWHAAWVVNGLAGVLFLLTLWRTRR